MREIPVSVTPSDLAGAVLTRTACKSRKVMYPSGAPRIVAMNVSMYSCAGKRRGRCTSVGTCIITLLHLFTRAQGCDKKHLVS